MIKSLKIKMSIVYICLVLIMAFIGLASVVNLYSVSKAIDALMVDNYKSINAISYMMEAFERQDSAALIYINVDKNEGIDLFAQNNNEFMKWYIVAADNVTEVGEKELLAHINTEYYIYTKLFSELQEISNQQGIDNSAYFYNSVMNIQFDKIKMQLRDLTRINETAMFRAKDLATKNAEKSMYIIFLFSTTGVVGGFILSAFLTKRFLEPLDVLTKSVKAMKVGNWGQQIHVVTRDEVGELSMEFNHMTKRLHQYEQSTLGKLMTEKNKSLTIVKSIPDPLIVLDTTYRIHLLNEACERFFGIDEKKILKKHFLEVIMNGELFAIISNAYENRSELKEKIIRISKSEDYYFNVIVTMTKDMEQRTTGLVVLLQNVTQLKELEKMRTDFIATISHEFKTPLTSIMMGTSMVLNETTGVINKDQLDIMNTIKEDGERLTSLVSDLLELSKIESGKAVYNMESCSLDEIVMSSIKQFTMQAEHKNVNILNRASDHLPKVTADKEKILWVINNLIGNALKYTDKGDQIVISSMIKNESIHISVEDNGSGIPEEFLQKIFDKYVQVKGQDLETRGTGLGLAVVKEIINVHGGEIWCESELDEGSTFTFTLPVMMEVPDEKSTDSG